MTTIVAIQYADGVLMGSDSLVTAERKYNHPRMAKITETGPYLIGGSGEVAACDIVQHIWEPPIPTVADKKDLYHFMIAVVIPAMKKCFKENEYKWDAEDDETKFAFLIAIDGEVFEIADDLSVCLDAAGFYGIGSGSSLALGALKAKAEMPDALQIAADLDPYTAPPFIYQKQLKKISPKKAVK
jgi:ATP-dependent protease HslVU (ClpYQ) peptidase subunit